MMTILIQTSHLDFSFQGRAKNLITCRMLLNFVHIKNDFAGNLILNTRAQHSAEQKEKVLQ
jgi:hypothetical protein